MFEEKEDWKESWIGWPSKDKAKDTPKSETKPAVIDTQGLETLKNKLKSEGTELGSNIYEKVAVTVGLITSFVGLVFFFEERWLGFLFIAIGFLEYISISWFGRVLKGLEENNKLLEKIIKRK